MERGNFQVSFLIFHLSVFCSLFLSLSFWIEILFQFFFCHGALNSIGRYFGFSSPKDCVQHELPKIIIAPVFVEVRAGEAKAASAVGTLGGPGDVLKLAAFDGFADLGIALVRTIAAAHCAFGRNGRENRRHVFHSVAEAHVEIPLVSDREWCNAIGDGMFGEHFEIGVPVRVYGAIDFETAANPIEKFFLAFFNRGLSRVMDAAQADAFLHQSAELFKMLILQRWMSGAAIGVDDNAIRAVERAGVLGPAVAIDDGGNALDLVEAFPPSSIATAGPR